MSVNYDEWMLKFLPSRRISCSEPVPIGSVDFDNTGKYCVTSSANYSLELYNCETGKPHKTVKSFKVGTHAARFTHSSTNIIYASSEITDSKIRYISTHDYGLIRTFKGHESLVSSLTMCPINDTFLSTSMDRTIRLWDLKSSGSVAVLKSPFPSFTAFDPSGIVYAAASNPTNEIALYDLRKITEPPFFVAQLPHPSLDWRNIEFSNDGTLILLATNNGVQFLYDAFDCHLVAVLKGCEPHQPSGNRKVFWPDDSGACFSNDGKWVFSTSLHGVMVYDLRKLEKNSASNNEPQVILPSKSIRCLKHEPRSIRFNPKLWQFATIGNDIMFWLPDIEKD